MPIALGGRGYVELSLDAGTAAWVLDITDCDIKRAIEHVAETLSVTLSDWKVFAGAALALEAETASLAFHLSHVTGRRRLVQWADAIDLSATLGDVEEGRGITSAALTCEALELRMSTFPAREHVPRGLPAPLHHIHRTRLPSE